MPHAKAYLRLEAARNQHSHIVDSCVDKSLRNLLANQNSLQRGVWTGVHRQAHRFSGGSLTDFW